MDRDLTFFVSDVHLGLDVKNPAAREARFVEFLRNIPAERTRTLYLLGDIWDFWYEYRDVVPKGYVRVLGAITDLMDKGVNVCYFQGNHDVWTYSYFKELGMVPLEQPLYVTIGMDRFCLGHGDGLGPGDFGYKALRAIFHSKFLQTLFSTLHPWLAFRLGNGWSRNSRLGKDFQYIFRGTEERLYRFCSKALEKEAVNYFIFGHYHCFVDMPVSAPGRSARLMVLKDWMDGSDFIVHSSRTGAVYRNQVP